MHSQIYLDPRIRDYVFIPLVFLMFAMQLTRIRAFQYMNETKNFLLDQARISDTTLRETIIEADFHEAVEAPEESVDVQKKLDEIDANHKEGQALQRSARLRTDAGWLPENAVKTRKAFYCADKSGYLNKPVVKSGAPPMGPDMMGTMMKQNMMGVVNMFMF